MLRFFRDQLKDKDTKKLNTKNKIFTEKLRLFGAETNIK